ncbi:hypothetical protein MRB53_040988 [Persea americana]|nr:hypothetical protein MRB53_040988 [Persea americana]
MGLSTTPVDRDFAINKALSCYYSAFFKGCFEAQERDPSPIELEDVTDAVLQAYIFCLCKRCIRFPDGQKLVLRHVPLLVDLYIFADKYDTKDVRNKVVEEVCGAFMDSDRDSCSMMIAHLPSEATISVVHYLASDQVQRTSLCPRYKPRVTTSVKAPKEYLECKRKGSVTGV